MKIARMVLEGDAFKLASLPLKIFDDALKDGMNPRLVEGVKAARAAFYEKVTENDIKELMDQFSKDIEDGLKELDNE